MADPDDLLRAVFNRRKLIAKGGLKLVEKGLDTSRAKVEELYDEFQEDPEAALEDLGETTGKTVGTVAETGGRYGGKLAAFAYFAGDEMTDGMAEELGYNDREHFLQEMGIKQPAIRVYDDVPEDVRGDFDADYDLVDVGLIDLDEGWSEFDLRVESDSYIREADKREDAEFGIWEQRGDNRVQVEFYGDQ